MCGGIVEEQLTELEKTSDGETDEHHQKAVEAHTHAWHFIFDSLQLDRNSQQQLTDEELTDPNGVVCKAILFLYSMETFIYRNVNAGTRNQDHSKISSLGPFAFALSWITWSA